MNPRSLQGEAGPATSAEAARSFTRRRVRRAVDGLALLVLLCPLRLPAATLAELLEDPGMNPKRFASYFGDFAYEFHREIQPPSAFLRYKRGDCDDYAILADLVLKQRNFSTRLIQVRLAGQIDHAVCYVNEARAYLDYNNRAVFFTLARSGASLRTIATKVADSLEANWTSAYEFEFTGGKKELVATVVKTAPPELDPVPGKKAGNAVKVDF
jgi:hypothetical protein